MTASPPEAPAALPPRGVEARGSKPTGVGLDGPRAGRVSRPGGLQGALADRQGRIRGVRLGETVWRTPTAIVAVAVALAFVPFLGLPAFYDSLLYLILHWIVLATSWNILSGYSGYFSFGHGAFFGAGLYTSATLMAKLDWPFLSTLPVAAGVACVLGVAVGAIVFRVKGIRGEVFALLTLAVTFVIGTIIVNTPIDGGNGVSLAAVAVPKIGPTQSSTFYLLALAAATLTLLVAWGISVSKLGAGLFAIHDDEDAAEVMGVPTYRYKLIALGISCALAGVAGGIHALFLNYVTVGEVFTITVPLTVVLMSVLGGTRHWAGPAIGAVAITLLLYSFTTASCRGCSARWRGAACRWRRRKAGCSPRRCARCRWRRARSCSPPGAWPSPSAECRRWPASTSRSGAARSSACLGPMARASRPSSTSSAAITYPAPAASSSKAGNWRAARRTASPAQASRARTRSRGPSATRRCSTTSRWPRCSAAGASRRRPSHGERR
jgi:ABC-type branched-subunit amino acid transport system permease subunit